MAKEWYLHARLYPGQDSDLIAWLQDLDDRGENRSRAIREAVRRGLGYKDYSAVPDAALIEAVVERAVARALAGVALAYTAPGRDGEVEEVHGERLDDLMGQFG
jgi:hypothetical protein